MQPAAAEIEREVAAQSPGAAANAGASFEEEGGDLRGEPAGCRDAGRTGADHDDIDFMHAPPPRVPTATI